MPSLKLSNPFRRGADRPSLKDRAAALRATARRVMRAEPVKPGQDVELLALGSEFDAAHAEWREAVEANREPHSRYAAYLIAAKERGGPSMKDCRAASALPGVSEASDAEEKAFETAGEVSLAALKLPARTLAGLAVQARAVIPHVWAGGSYEKDGSPEADENIDKEAVRSLIESCCAAAGMDWRGAPVSEASATEPVEIDRTDQQGPLGDLLAGIDLPAMPTRTLSALHDHVEALNNICFGLAAQPRSLNDDRTLNEARVVLYRLAEHLLQEASNACLQEAKRRAAATGNDRAALVAMVARHTIENDDPNEMRALARDLLTLVNT